MMLLMRCTLSVTQHMINNGTYNCSDTMTQAALLGVTPTGDMLLPHLRLMETKLNRRRIRPPSRRRLHTANGVWRSHCRPADAHYSPRSPCIHTLDLCYYPPTRCSSPSDHRHEAQPQRNHDRAHRQHTRLAPWQGKSDRVTSRTGRLHTGNPTSCSGRGACTSCFDTGRCLTDRRGSE